MLPGHDGFELCRAIRKRSACPIIMLTARDTEVDKVMGLSLGADDYVSKPFLPLEFVARVKAQLRRYRNYGGERRDEAEEDVWRIRGLVVDGRRRVCTVNGREVALTKTEFSILLELCRAQGSVVSSDDLYYRVFGEEYYAKGGGARRRAHQAPEGEDGGQWGWQGIHQDRMGVWVSARLIPRIQAPLHPTATLCRIGARRVIVSAIAVAAAFLLVLWVLDTAFNGVLANWFEDTFAPTLWYQDYSDLAAVPQVGVQSRLDEGGARGVCRADHIVLGVCHGAHGAPHRRRGARGDRAQGHRVRRGRLLGRSPPG